MSKEIAFEDVSDEEVPVSTVRRTQALGPFIKVMNESWEADSAKGLNVKANVAGSAENRFRAAAAELQMGVSIAKLAAGAEYGDGKVVPAGMTRLIIQAKEKRVYTPRKASNSKKSAAKK